MPICTKCLTEKDIETFSWRKKGKARHTICKICYKQILRNHYLKNKQSYFLKNRRISQRHREMVIEYLLHHPCVICGEKDPAALDFHHLDRSTKEDTVANLLQSRTGWSKIIREIKKCEVQCSSWHRKTTAKERGWYKKYAHVLCGRGGTADTPDLESGPAKG